MNNLEAITREEQLLNSIATKEAVNIDPVTREEQYLAYIAGLTDKKPEKAITRKEMFYDAIAENGTGGGGGTAKPEQSKTVEIVENGDYKVTPDSGKVLSSVTAKVNVPDRYEEGFEEGKDSVKLQEKTVTQNGDVLPDNGFQGMSKVIVAVEVGGTSKPEQEKTVTIKQNGTTEVTPDEGKTLSKVTVETNVLDGEVGKPYIDTSQITNFYYFAAANRFDYSTLSRLDTSNGESFSYMFAISFNLGTIPPIDTSKGTNFNCMFERCSKLKTIPLLDLSKATSTESMFVDCSLLETIPLLDLSDVKYGQMMFKNCRRLTTIPLLDTSNVETFYGMFSGCSSLTEIPKLDTSKGKTFGEMFKSCSVLKSVTLTTAKSDLSANTFQGCTALTDLTIGEDWAVSIYLTYSTALTQESLHGMIENLADLTGSTTKTFQVGETNLAKIDEEHLAMLTAKNWSYS